MSGFVSRKQSEDDSYHHRTSKRKHDRIRGDDGGNREKRRELHDAVADRDADGASEERQHDGLGEELYDDVGIERADGAADTDFPSTLGNGNEHDVHNADTSDDERYRRDAHKEDFERIGNARHGGEHVGRTRNREVGVRRILDLEFREVVVGNGRLGRIHGFGRRCHDDELRNVFAPQKAVLQRGDRNVYRVVGARHWPASRTLRFGDSDDAEVDVTHLDVTAEGVFGTEKIGGGRRSENRHFRTLLHVGFGNEHPVLRLDVLDFGIVAAHSIYGRGSVDGAHDDLLGSLRYGGYRGDSGERANFFDVVDGEDVGTLDVGRPDVALAVSARTKREEVGTEGLDIRLDALLRPLAEREEHDDRSDADDDSETRKSRAHLVGTDAPKGVEQMFEYGHGNLYIVVNAV